MSSTDKTTTLPYRSDCHCACHRTGAVHMVPCCQPDPVPGTADCVGMRDCKCMPGRQCRNTGCVEDNMPPMKATTHP